MKTVKVIVTETGKGKAVNQDWQVELAKKHFKDFDENSPERPAIDPNGQPLQPGEYECKEVWQMLHNIGSLKPGKWETLKDQDPEKHQSCGLRIAYQSIEAAVKGEKELDTNCPDCVLGYPCYMHGQKGMPQSTPVNEAIDDHVEKSTVEECISIIKKHL